MLVTVAELLECIDELPALDVIAGPTMRMQIREPTKIMYGPMSTPHPDRQRIVTFMKKDYPTHRGKFVTKWTLELK